MTLLDTAQDEGRFNLGGVLRRNARLLIGSALVFMTVSGAVVSSVRPVYRAETRILVEPRQLQVATFEPVQAKVKPDMSVIRSEIDTITAPALTLRVIDRLGLRNDDRLARDSRFSPKELLDQLLARPPAVQGVLPGSDGERLLVEAVLGNLLVENDGLSYVMKLSYRSTFPELAAAVANAYAQVYHEQQLEQRTAAAGEAAAWLEQQAGELRGEVRRSDEAVQQFIQVHNLGQAKGSTLVAQQLAELNSQLVVATDQLARKEAELAQLRHRRRPAGESPGGMVDNAAVLSSPLVQRLREQEAELLRHQAEVGLQYQSGNRAMQQTAAALENVRGRIAVETQRVVDAVEAETRELAGREADLRQQVRQLSEQLARDDHANVGLMELERTASANQNLYQSLLTRSKQILAEERLRNTDTRIISPAFLESKEMFPTRKALYGLAGGGSLGLALLLVLGVEALRRGYRSEREIQAATGWPAIGSVPRLPGMVRPHERVMREPGGIYADAIDMVVKTLFKGRSDGKVILVTSSVPQEGKSVLAASLARVIAAQGRSTLLLDCDLRRPSVAKLFGVDAAMLPASPLVSGRLDPQALFHDPASGLAVAAAMPSTRLREAFAPERLARLMGLLRHRYDVIVLDAPPVLPVADVLALGPLADTTLFAVQWEKTPRSYVDTAVRSLVAAEAANPQIVLVQVDLRKQAAYGTGERAECYRRYGKYYLTPKGSLTDSVSP